MKSSSFLRSTVLACRILLLPCVVAIVLLCLAGGIRAGEASRGPAKIKVLIVDGFSNHDWRQTTRLVRRILERSGRFEVAVSTSPPTRESDGWDAWRPRFHEFDVVIQNCNSLGNRPTWPREVEIALEQYVREGGGLYVFHSANNAFAHWEEYNRMIGLGWRKKDGGWAITIDADEKMVRIPPGVGEGTHHGPRVDAIIHVLGRHPIHEGYPRRWMTPQLEVYQYARGPAENLTVLSYAPDPETGTNWPIEWVVKYGRGSVYNSTMGHVWTGDDNPASMRCVGFQTTLIRAAEWLATGQVRWPVPADFPSSGARQQVLFRKAADGYNNIRIPAICVTKKGTLLALAEGREGGDAGRIETILRRSEDGGETWGPIQVVWSDGANTCGNPTPVVDYDTGVIWLLHTWNLGGDRETQIMTGRSKDVRRVFLSKSTDDGRTWTNPRDMSDTLRRPAWRWYATGPCNGIQLTRGPHKGRLVAPANHSDKATAERDSHTYRSHIIYSDDHGRTWRLGAVQPPLTNESAVVELADGALMQNMRSYHGRHCRAVAVSRDGGVTFGDVRLDESLQSPVCQGSILRVSWPEEGRSRIVFSSPGGKDRRDMTLRISYDEGRTWPVQKVIYAGPCAYSNLVKLPDGRLGVLYEKGEESPYETIAFETLSMAQLESGGDDGA